MAATVDAYDPRRNRIAFIMISNTSSTGGSAWRAWRARRQWDSLMQRRAGAPQAPLMLHIGCGDIDATGFINIDARPAPHVHIVSSSLFRLQMVPDGVADLVYMCHVLEHVPLNDVVETLREMHRILCVGGVLRLSVPDFDLIIAAYEAAGRRIAAIERGLMGGQNHPYNFHYAVFNAEQLRDALLESGFSTTRHWDPRHCAHHDFEDWASREMAWHDRRFPISLNIEGVK
jgi:predicted SAM-dependent methyltransferase